MVGNAAAALQGAPVTTLDVDFMFRKTPTSLRKLKIFADVLEAQILKPYYPLSSLYRVMKDDTGMQVDFMSVFHGIKSFENPRSDAVEVEFDKYNLKVASLENIIRSKKALADQRIGLSLTSWKKRWMKRKKDRKKQLRDLRRESTRHLTEQIRRQLALPMNRRTHFLRKRLPGGGPCL